MYLHIDQKENKKLFVYVFVFSALEYQQSVIFPLYKVSSN